MRILILANNDVGLYKFRKELIEELLKENKVIISLPKGEYISDLIDMGCEFFETPINRRGTNPIKDINLFKNYINLIRKTKPDVVLTYTIKPNIYGGLACRIIQMPYITNVTGLGTAVENDGLLQKITLSLYKLALGKAKKVFFQNKENMNFFSSKKIRNENHKLLPGSGVNTNEYSLLPYPENEKEINFLFVGRAMKEKGLDHYIEAAEILKRKYSNINFHVVGGYEGNYYNKLKIFHENGTIQYHGMQKDVKSFWKTAHCTVHPTYYPEGMSNVLLESAACGRPIITTNRSGCREIVEEGINGFIVEARDTQSLIGKIEKFLNLSNYERKRMGILGREKVKKEFNRNFVIEAYLKELETLR